MRCRSSDDSDVYLVSVSMVFSLARATAHSHATSPAGGDYSRAMEPDLRRSAGRGRPSAKLTINLAIELVAVGKDGVEALQYERGGAQVARIYIRQDPLPARLPECALGLHLALSLRGQLGHDDTPIGLGASALDVTGGRQVLKHLGDRRWRELGSEGKLTGRERALLAELDQEFHLGVADLRAEQVCVAPAQTP